MKLKDWHYNNCTVYCGEDRSTPVAYTGAKMDNTGKGIETCQANALLISQAPWMFETLRKLYARPDALHFIPEMEDVKRIIKLIESDALYSALEKELK
jgi:hypothetical protein